MAGYVIGVDVGTSGSRAVLADTEGRQISIAASKHSTTYPLPSWAEQRPEDIYDGVAEAVRQAVASSGVQPRDIEAVCLSTVFHSLILLDSADRRLTECIPWLDTRSTEDANDIFHNAKDLYLRIGCPANSSYPLSKAAWFRRCRPDLYACVGRAISIKDYLIRELTGEYLVDSCVAGGSGFLNVSACDWDEEALAYVGAKREWFSPVVPATTVLRMTLSACRKMGLSDGTKVVIGAGDGLLASVGSGAARSGSVAVMMGTSAACRMFTKTPRLDDPSLQRTWSYPLVDGIWATGTSVNNCGAAHEWILNTLFSWETTGGSTESAEDLYATLQRYLDSSVAGANGLSFLPWVLSERGPYWPTRARGVLLGMTRDHTRADIYRSVVEGIVCLASNLVDFVVTVAGPAADVRATGGFTNSEGWMQILASMLETPVLLPESRESVAYGACLLALVSLGVIPGIEETAGYTRTVRTYEPVQEHVEAYRRLKALIGEQVVAMRNQEANTY
ncbi:MAG: gluconokinase [Bacillota bacterium]